MRMLQAMKGRPHCSPLPPRVDGHVVCARHLPPIEMGRHEFCCRYRRGVNLGAWCA